MSVEKINFGEFFETQQHALIGNYFSIIIQERASVSRDMETVTRGRWSVAVRVRSNEKKEFVPLFSGGQFNTPAEAKKIAIDRLCLLRDELSKILAPQQMQASLEEK